jgi:hypothetical protein
MSICREFIIKDILDYEINNDISIFDELGQANLFVILDLIKLGNKCDDAEAESIFNRAVEELGFDKVVEEIAYELIGRRPEDATDGLVEKKYNSFSDMLGDFYNSVQSVDKNFGLTEFWNISTKYLYKYADGVKSRYINEKNMELQSQFSNVAMFMSALAGKLKECPQLDEDGTIHKKTLAEKIKELKVGGKL